jgi:hypothetical protein
LTRLTCELPEACSETRSGLQSDLRLLVLFQLHSTAAQPALSTSRPQKFLISQSGGQLQHPSTTRLSYDRYRRADLHLPSTTARFWCAHILICGEPLFVQLDLAELLVMQPLSTRNLGAVVTAKGATDGTSNSSSTGSTTANSAHDRSQQHQCGSTRISHTTMCVVSAFGVVPDGCLATGVGKLGMARPATGRTTRLLTKSFATAAAVPIHLDRFASLSTTRMSLTMQCDVCKQKQTQPVQLLKQQRGARLCSSPPMTARPMRSRLLLHMQCQHVAMAVLIQISMQAACQTLLLLVRLCVMWQSELRGLC